MRELEKGLRGSQYLLSAWWHQREFPSFKFPLETVGVDSTRMPYDKVLKEFVGVLLLDHEPGRVDYLAGILDELLSLGRGHSRRPESGRGRIAESHRFEH